MKRRRRTQVMFSLTALACIGAMLFQQEPATHSPAPPNQADAHWPSWRGPLGTGVAPHAKPPTEWSEEHNVRWKVALPGLGHSTPVVWGERLFLTWALPIGEQVDPAPETAPGAHDNPPVVRARRFEIAAYARTDGKLLWRRALHEELPHERTHSTGSFASASPVTDGEHLFAFFGSRGLFCLDLDGYVIWEKQLGQMLTKHHHGEGSTPALHGDAIVINWDHEQESFTVCLDKATGEERWRVQRDEVTSWSSPIIAVVDGKPQAIISATGRIRGYDLADGKQLWNCPGMAHNVVATPVYGDGILMAGSSYEKQALIGLRLAGARGSLPDTKHFLWYRRRGAPYVPSPLLLNGWLYLLNHNQGFLSRIRAESGDEPERPLRLAHLDTVFASPMAADGRIYIADRSGLTVVLAHEDPPRILAWNSLDDGFSASPVAVEDQLFLRGEHFLYCLAEDPDPAEGH